ncbi:hypothetical protein J2S09_000021 [Bacillus fengqiuensis]|nr:hypothetical protein [Bacillus fengqiuensis]
MAARKRQSKAKSPITISNTGFIGATFADQDELMKHEYYFSRKSMQITHHVLDGLLQGVNCVFEEHGVPAYLSCVYLPKYKKMGLVLSTNSFRKREGIGYFINYLKEIGHIDWEEKTKEYEIHNTGFIGVVFADLEKIERFTFEFEMKLITKFVKELVIPAKELFLQHHVKAYISGVECSDQNKLGFVLSVKPYDERKEADLYFKEYLKERGFYEEDEDEQELVPIHTKWSLFSS